MKRFFCFTLMLGFFAAVAVACDPVEDLTFVNAADRLVAVTYAVDDNERAPFVLQPGEIEERQGVLFWKGRILSVIAIANGRVVFQRQFDFDELRALDFTVEISDNATGSPASTPMSLP